MDRKAWDKIISGSGAIVAAVIVLLGAAAIYGGMFGRDNVRDRLEPQKVAFPPAEAMSEEETAEVGDFAGQKVENGVQAEAYSRYIGLHVGEMAEGKTYAELGPVVFGLQDEIAAAEEAGESTEALEAELAAVSGQRDTIFKGETLRAILLNAYGWWTVSTLALYAGYGLVAAGLVLALLSFLGFRHAKKVDLKAAPVISTKAA